MKKLVILAALILIICAGSIASVSASTSINGLNTTDDLNQALKDAKDLNKTVAIVFDQDSCVYCEMLKDDVLSNPQVQKVLNEKCIVVIVDVNKNPDVASKYKVFGTPGTVFVKSDGSEISRVEGYLPANEFLNSIKGI